MHIPSRPIMRRIALPPFIIRHARLSGMMGGMAVLLFFVLMGCAPRPLIRPEAPAIQTSDDVEQRLRFEIKQWEKTPHVLGGKGRDGIDCSGFVKVLNQKLFGIELPRTAEEQARMGTPVPGKRLQAGDLVFFLLATKKPHVGIYLSHGEFVHVSNSRGVMISNVNDGYWRNYYWTARRILQM